ncbi:MAG TPA: hypothetical protein VLK34_00695 [Nocardioidaceae bacterium]|nr:hypothetical protein [Nocardioidaceae bacterium]
MISEFALSTKEALDEAAKWLADLGFVVARSTRADDPHRLTVYHNYATRHDVPMLVAMVDPIAVEIRD